MGGENYNLLLLLHTSLSLIYVFYSFIFPRVCTHVNLI